MTFPTLVAILLVCTIVMLPLCALGGKHYATWEGFEVDKLASIWLIQRHISPGATIEILPKGSPIKQGIPFDVPDAGITRTFNQSSFDSLLAHFQLHDSRLDKIALLIRDIELNTWEAKRFKKSSEMEVFFFDLVKSQLLGDQVIEKSNAYMDSFYESVTGDLELNTP